VDGHQRGRLERKTRQNSRRPAPEQRLVACATRRLGQMPGAALCQRQLLAGCGCTRKSAVGGPPRTAGCGQGNRERQDPKSTPSGATTHQIARPEVAVDPDSRAALLWSWEPRTQPHLRARAAGPL